MAATTISFLTPVAEQPLHRALGLTDGELERIRELLGREPNHFELAVFSLLWSEHCAYKHSAPLLGRLPSSGTRVLQGPGENAGVIDLGEGEAVAFKVESHNHPSAVEPFQGAATGIGGILRDVVAMGARPVALLDGLRFAEPDWHFERAVEGIGHYGNSAGIPTIGGDTVFDPAYRDNCLVNAMCVGLLPSDRVTRARARGTGHTVVLFGATTGRDGIGGASVLASQELGEETHEKRPSVQVGDPFTGKKLIETSIELVESGLVESLQDLGAAGLASSLAEMARDGAGIDVHLDRVPLREEGMEPWEIMISESQERMVAVVRPAMLERVEEVCRHWELGYAEIGTVTDTGQLRCFHDGETVASIPAELLTEEAPRYEVERRPRSPAPEPPALRAPSDEAALLELLASPNVRSRGWIYHRYDHLVGSRTVRRPGLDAAVLRLRPSLRGLAVSLDGSGRVCRLDPQTGGAAAVLEAARNVACAGGEPLAVTDCLNFGNPERPEIGWELAEAIEVRRPRPGRQADSRDVAGRGRGAAGWGNRAVTERLRVPGPLRLAGRTSRAARSRGGGGARRVPVAIGSPTLARSRRLGGRARRLLRRGGDRKRRRSGARPSLRPRIALRRGRRPGRDRLLSGRARVPLRRPAAPDRGGRRR